MNTLKDLLKGFKVDEHKPSLPEVRTPAPERNKVVSQPTRVAVNKQAALLIAPVRCWLSHPPSEPKLPTKEQKQIDELIAELKIERNSHAQTRDELGNARGQLKGARSLVKSLEQEITSLKSEIAKKDDEIRQLEDIRL